MKEFIRNATATDSIPVGSRAGRVVGTLSAVHRAVIVGALVAATAPLVGCGAAAPMAETPVNLPAARELGPEAETYTLDGRGVSLEIDVQAMAAHTLRFEGIKGKFAITPSDILASNIEMTVDIGSASATLGVVADVAKSSDFLDSNAFPTAHFVSRSFGRKQGKEGGLELVGELEIHGVKRPVRVPAALAFDHCAIQFLTEFAVDRRQYHVESNGTLDGVVSDGVTIRIRANVPRKDRPASCGNAGDAAVKSAEPVPGTVKSSRGG